ncbi:MAG: prepilin-type N-terminal cleavage/methylation domain-containing protein [Gemmatimonadetes bacterium]|nr:prepilin-type N-terminal cleavage/methylation domain-containing protein [Gemmatimonadota bacterium]NIO31733.1 prepilin-type N-terminal cleavage/methylation domain-containing protein [Gemmatimonadota bacterium]
MAQRGFTLVELLAGIVIISILAAMTSATFYRSKNAAYLAAMQSDLRNLIRAQEEYHAWTSGYFTNDPGNADGATYTKSADGLDFTPSENVVIKIRANNRGWSAQAEHENRSPDKFYCAVFIGDVKAFDPADEEGVIACEPKKKGKKR